MKKQGAGPTFHSSTAHLTMKCVSNIMMSVLYNIIASLLSCFLLVAKHFDASHDINHVNFQQLNMK